MSIRCMQHNNTLTLYCLTERKILCVNCTYGDFRHRTHKVLPLRDSLKYISQDNDELNRILKDDFIRLQENIKSCKENVFVLNNSLGTVLKKMEEDYQRKRKILEGKYETAVRKVREKFEDMVKKSETVEKQIQEFKFKMYESLSKIGLGKQVESTVG